MIASKMKVLALTLPNGSLNTAITHIRQLPTSFYLSLQWRRSNTTFQRKSLSMKIRSTMEDEGSWTYSSEWWGSDDDHLTRSVFRARSLHGNGIVSVLAYPSSSPSPVHWLEMEHWLRKRCAELCSGLQLKVLGYQWRVLRFNDVTRQSTAKVMVISDLSDPASVYYMQQPHCLAKSYIKSMVVAGLTALSSSNYDLLSAIGGKRKMRVLCIGHGGGSLPLFIASKIRGAIVDSIEIDPVVTSASVNAMGFPVSSVASPGAHVLSKASLIDDVLWKDIHQRLFVYVIDAEDFILNTANIYDVIFIDAYDGGDVFPHKLWDPDSPFLKALGSRLHPYHGTVVVNLHSNAVKLSPDGKVVSEVCQAYKDLLLSIDSSTCEEQLLGMGFVVSVPWVRNTTLVICRGFKSVTGVMDRNLVLNDLISKSLELEKYLDLPFSCLEYFESGFSVLDSSVHFLH